MPDEPKPDTPPSAPPKPAAPAAAAKPPAAPKAPAVMAATPWEDELTQQLAAEFGERIVGFYSYLGQTFLTVQPEAAPGIIDYLKRECAFDYLVDITAVHFPDKPEPFEVIYILYSFERNLRIRVKTRIKDGAALESVVWVHVTADWLEREVFDMFGIRFNNHPDLKRILMPDEWEGHPLRKDYSILKMDERWVRENLGIESGQ
jgi:NADH-quinone oxidoreductase subunit C